MLFFDALPNDLKMELLKYVHPSLLIENKCIKKCLKLVAEPYIFSLDCFKSCDIELLWQNLYNRRYSKFKPPNLTYKEAYIKHMAMEVKVECDYLIYAAKNGLEKYIFDVYDDTSDYFDYGLWDLLEVAARHLQVDLVKKLLMFNYNAKKVSVHTNALKSILTSRFDINDLPKVEAIIDLLKTSNTVTMPQVTYTEYNIFVFDMGCGSYLEHDRAVEFIQFLLKYNMIPDHQVFFEKLCLVLNVNIKIIEWCLEHMNVTITNKLFRHLCKYDDTIKLLTDGKYEITKNNLEVIVGYAVYDKVLDLYIEQQCKKRKISVQ